MKTCSKRRKTKPLDDFYDDKSRCDGPKVSCAWCNRKKGNKLLEEL
jgi:hypothetical protein